MYTDYVTKKRCKSTLIQWIFLLQEFDLEITYKKEADNVGDDQLFRLPNAPNIDVPINEYFLDE